MVILDMMMTGHHGVTHLILMVGVEEAGGGFTQGKINTALVWCHNNQSPKNIKLFVSNFQFLEK